MLTLREALPFLSDAALRELFSVSPDSPAASGALSFSLSSVLANLLEHEDTALERLLPGLASWERHPISSHGLSARARNALDHVGITTWGELGDRSIRDIRKFRHVGAVTVDDILERAIEISLLEPIDESHITTAAGPMSVGDTVQEAQRFATRPASEALEILTLVATWGSSVRSAERLGELVTLAVDTDTLPPDVRRAWNRFEALALTTVRDSNLANEPVDALVDHLLGHFDQARLAVLEQRILAEHPQTLQELADALSISRERVRQLQLGIPERLSCLLEESRFRPLAWRANDLGLALGPAAPADAAATLAALDQAVRGARNPSHLVTNLLLYIAGPYHRRHGWLIRADARIPTPEDISKHADEYGILPVSRARDLLTEAGLKPTFHDAWIDSLRKFRRDGDNLLVWTINVIDKCVTVLAIGGEPTDTETLVQVVGEGHNVRSVRARLFEDPRVMRVNRTDWALRSWNLEEYSGITDEIAQRIEEAGGRVLLEDVVDELVTTFGVRESSVRLYAAAPMFVIENGWIRLRHESEPFEIDQDLSACRGVFIPAHGRLSVLLPIDPEVLRGSGRPLPGAVAAALGVTPGHPRSFASEAAPVAVTWPVTAGLGPSLGSVRQLAEAVGARDGERLRLEFATETGHLAFQRVPADLSGLTQEEILPLFSGISPQGNPVKRVAAAIGVPETELRRVLLSRGDAELANLLPRPKVDSDLDEAFDQLANLLDEMH